MKSGFFAPSIVRALYKMSVQNGVCEAQDASLRTIGTNAGAPQKFFCTERSTSALAGPESIKNERIALR
jgi:hypothetical protein